MMLSSLSLLLLLPAVLGSPLVNPRRSHVTIPISVRINATGHANLAEADRARAKAFVANAKAHLSKAVAGAAVSVPVTNAAVVYTANVGVGSPATNYVLLIETSSSNTWVGGGNTPYQQTSTSVDTGNSVSLTSGSGTFTGEEFFDQVTIAPGLVIPQQSIGVAFGPTAFQGTDGVLGIGPVDLTVGTLSPDTGSSIPTVTDNLFAQGSISSDEIGISFEPTTQQSITNGELTFGGTDSSKFAGTIKFTPLTSTSPANLFWGINENNVYGTSTNILSSTAGIVDTGTTLVLIATDAFSRYQTATGGVIDNNTGLIKFTTTQFNNLKSLNFVISGTKYALTANAQIWPRSLNTFIGGTSGSIYGIVNDLGTPSGQGLDFINGYTFLERFYSVFDTANRRVGFATTPFTTATTN